MSNDRDKPAVVAPIEERNYSLTNSIPSPILNRVVMRANDVILITEAEPIDSPGPRILYVNDMFTQLTGYSPEEVIGKSPRILQGPDTDRATLNKIRHALENWQPIEVEILNYRKDGTPIWAELSIVPLADEMGRFTHWFAIQRDISQRKETEQKLRNSQQMFKILMDNLPMILWITDARGRTIFVNHEWVHFTGHTEEDVLRTGWQELIHPEDAEKVDCSFREAQEQQKPFFIEFRRLHQEQAYHWIELQGVPRFSDSGLFEGYLGFSMDVTERKIMRDQLLEASKLESLGRLAGGIAHDFNNLLTAILGYTELAQDMLPEENEVKSTLNHVLSASERCAELTRQLLMYARRQMVEFTQVDINPVITQLLPLLKRTIGDQYEIVHHLADEPCVALTNAGQVEQVLMNMIVNARDAMPYGGRIVLETSRANLDEEYVSTHFGANSGEYVMFSVSDNGIGMTSEVREHIFEPFFTTKEVGKGTGLGLATCYGIVKQSKGNIWVYSEPGRGTTFKVYLPRISSTPIATTAPVRSFVSSASATILVVDDEPMVRDITVRTLRSHGYEVLAARNEADALQIQSEFEGNIDLMITDVVMPLMGGRELSDRIEKLRPALKTLYMSGYTENVIVREGILKPGVTLLTKPFSASDLLEKVNTVLRESPVLN